MDNPYRVHVSEPIDNMSDLGEKIGFGDGLAHRGSSRTSVALSACGCSFR